jgi:hypothetical protein
MTAATKDLPGLEEGIAVLEGLIAEGSCLIDEQVRLIKAAHARGESTPEAEHTLEIMFELQAAHMVRRDSLIEELNRR